MPHNVFAHDNSVVNQQTHAQAQGHQRDHVDGKTQHIHEQESADQRDGQRQPGNDGGAPGIEEQKHNQNGQRCAFQQGAAYIVYRHTNGARAVHNRF